MSDRTPKIQRNPNKKEGEHCFGKKYQSIYVRIEPATVSPIDCNAGNVLRRHVEQALDW